MEKFTQDEELQDKLSFYGSCVLGFILGIMLAW